MGLAKPCVDCLNVLKWINVRNIYYTGADGKLKVEGAR